MKKIIALCIVSMLTLTGCATHGNPVTPDNYHCQQIIQEMYDAPHRYQTVGRNKRLATIEAKLQKDYQHYDCSRYRKSLEK